MLTVLLATRNGARILPSVLEAFAALQAPPGGWRLVIVDNGSTDGTREAIAAFETHLPLTYLYEPAAGKNAALNTGLAAIAGDLVVLTDDDVFPRRDWLIQLRAAADAHPDFAVFGGAVLPRWEVAPPDWVTAWVPPEPVFTISSPLLAEGSSRPELIFGPNMAVRADIFRKGHRFDVSIGPGPGSYAMGSETEFTTRLFNAGFATWYCPHAVVEHFIRAEQLRRSWILGRALRYGQGQYRLEHESTPMRSWAGVPRYLIRQMLVSAARVARAWLTGDREGEFQARWRFAYLRGQAIEARRMHRERGR